MSTIHETVRLRAIQPGDLPTMYEMQADPEANRMAVTFPRNRDEFDAHWKKKLCNPRNISRAVLSDEQFVGYISCFPMDGSDHVGYWIDRTCWGRGLASRALQLLLEEVVQRPLIAMVATSNVASLRVLQKSGFVVERTEYSPASERYPECEEAVLMLE
jgi:RimJ/RimL family protein N-acetyltransferase